MIAGSPKTGTEKTMKVCEAISNARKRAGMTQEQLAAKVHVTRQAV